MARLLAALVELFWGVVATLLIAGAALVAAVRLALPEVDAQREVLAAWVGAALGRPVVLGRIEADWYGWSPAIRVTDVRVLDPATRSEIVRFERAVLDLDPLASLVAGSLKPQRLLVAGAALTVLRDLDGRLSVAGMPPTESPLLTWLLEQDNFALTNASLVLVDAGLDQRFELTALSLAVDRDGDEPRIHGTAALPATLGGRLVFTLRGGWRPGRPWAGELDVAVENVALPALADTFGWQGEVPPAGALDLHAWSRWRPGGSADAHFVLTARDTAVRPRTELLAAHGQLARRGADWQLTVNTLDLPTFGPQPAPARLRARWQRMDDRGTRLALRAADLPIAALAQLADGVEALDDTVRTRLAAAAPGGRIARLDAVWRRPATQAPAYYAALSVVGLGMRATAGWPALEALSFDARLNAGGGLLRFTDARARCVDDARFVAPLVFGALNGALAWQWDEDGHPAWAVPRLAGRVNDVDFVLAGHLADGAAEAGPTVAATLAIPVAAGPRLHELVPRAVLPPRGETWLRQLFEDGTVRDGRLELAGTLGRRWRDTAHWTFDLDVADATLRYARHWPLARALDGHLAVRGPTATFTVARGRVLGADIVNADVELPDLFIRERSVHISGLARGPARSATDIILASPLRAGRAARLQELDIGQDIDVTLDMHLALYPGGPREVLGQARFAGNHIHARRQNIALADVHGTVSFTRGDWYGEKLQAVFDGMPVELVLNGGLDDPNYDSEFRMTGRATAATVLRQLERRVPAVHAWLAAHDALGAFSGELPWSAVLTLPVPLADGRNLPQRLVLESNLRGLGIDLPAPLAKAAAARRPLRLTVALHDGGARHTHIDWSDTLSAEIDLRGAGTTRSRLRRAEVWLGGDEPRYTGTPGVSFKGYVPYLPLDAWLHLLARGAAATPSAATELPLAFDFAASTLEFGTWRFSDLTLAGRRESTQWDIVLSGAAAAGTITLPRDPARNVLVVALDHLHLAPRTATYAAEGADARAPDPRGLPALDVHIGRFTYGDIGLGETRVLSSRRADGLHLDRLSCNDAEFELNARGDWRRDASGDQSQFDIRVESASLATLLERFGYSVANIRDGQTDITLDVRWPGAPSAFALARLTGSLELHVGSGRILDVDPGGGRLFGLLSLQTLPRRLSLDFDDLFGKGFAFDRIDGVFTLDRGDAYTEDLHMVGPSARIDVSGRTGLAHKDYDQRVVVTPTLSDTLPMAGALFGPIGAGAGAVYFLGQKLFKAIPEQVDRLLSRVYAVTGSWDDPVIEKI